MKRGSKSVKTEYTDIVSMFETLTGSRNLWQAFNDSIECFAIALRNVFNQGAEISNLKKSDIDIEQKKALVMGKGAKERIVYLNDVAKMRLLEYWDIREDGNEYAFCSIIKPYSKLYVSGLEIIVRNIGKLATVTKCHPHRFRRTTATRALKRGMSIIDIQRMLGHENVDTTRIYLDLDDTDLKYQHEKFL